MRSVAAAETEPAGRVKLLSHVKYYLSLPKAGQCLAGKYIRSCLRQEAHSFPVERLYGAPVHYVVSPVFRAVGKICPIRAYSGRGREQLLLRMLFLIFISGAYKKLHRPLYESLARLSGKALFHKSRHSGLIACRCSYIRSGLKIIKMHGFYELGSFREHFSRPKLVVYVASPRLKLSGHSPVKYRQSFLLNEL